MDDGFYEDTFEDWPFIEETPSVLPPQVLKLLSALESLNTHHFSAASPEDNQMVLGFNAFHVLYALTAVCHAPRPRDGSGSYIKEEEFVLVDTLFPMYLDSQGVHNHKFICSLSDLTTIISMNKKYLLKLLEIINFIPPPKDMRSFKKIANTNLKCWREILKETLKTTDEHIEQSLATHRGSYDLIISTLSEYGLVYNEIRDTIFCEWTTHLHVKVRERIRDLYGELSRYHFDPSKILSVLKFFSTKREMTPSQMYQHVIDM